jgi:hypothetical protein
MKRLAIDVVLLPPDPVMDMALAWNRTLLKNGPQIIVLDKNRRIPHVSMVMGCLASENLQRAISMLQAVSVSHHVMKLNVSRISNAKTASGTVASFDIELSQEVLRLHESIVTAFTPLLTQDTTQADLNDRPPIEPSAIEWINNYISDHCYDRFWPHITLGFGNSPNDLAPFTFQASRLAICHLGNYCTCTKILTETVLRPL